MKCHHEESLHVTFSSWFLEFAFFWKFWREVWTSVQSAQNLGCPPCFMSRTPFRTPLHAASFAFKEDCEIPSFSLLDLSDSASSDAPSNTTEYTESTSNKIKLASSTHEHKPASSKKPDADISVRALKTVDNGTRLASENKCTPSSDNFIGPLRSAIRRLSLRFHAFSRCCRSVLFWFRKQALRATSRTTTSKWQQC